MVPKTGQEGNTGLIWMLVAQLCTLERKPSRGALTIHRCFSIMPAQEHGGSYRVVRGSKSSFREGIPTLISLLLCPLLHGTPSSSLFSPFCFPLITKLFLCFSGLCCLSQGSVLGCRVTIFSESFSASFPDPLDQIRCPFASLPIVAPSWPTAQGHVCVCADLFNAGLP